MIFDSFLIEFWIDFEEIWGDVRPWICSQLARSIGQSSVRFLEKESAQRAAARTPKGINILYESKHS